MKPSHHPHGRALLGSLHPRDRHLPVRENRGAYVEVGGKQLALFNLGGEIHALDNACTHVGGPLSQGRVEGDEVECPWHGSRFDIRTGEIKLFPAREDVATYNVRVTDNDVEVEL